MLDNFSERFTPAIRGVVEFAKHIPGFNVLCQDDQVTLLKVSLNLEFSRLGENICQRPLAE